MTQAAAARRLGVLPRLAAVGASEAAAAGPRPGGRRRGTQPERRARPRLRHTAASGSLSASHGDNRAQPEAPRGRASCNLKLCQSPGPGRLNGVRPRSGAGAGPA